MKGSVVSIIPTSLTDSYWAGFAPYT